MELSSRHTGQPSQGAWPAADRGDRAEGGAGDLSPIRRDGRAVGTQSVSHSEGEVTVRTGRSAAMTGPADRALTGPRQNTFNRDRPLPPGTQPVRTSTELGSR